jgi:branched-chain amino acid transport system permease protein
MKQKNILLIIVTLLVALIPPFWLPPHLISLLFLFFIYTIMAEAFNLLSGFSGILALGFFGFVGFGEYMFLISSTIWGLPWWISLLFCGLTCALLALATSFLILRMRGLYFAMGTLVAANALCYGFQAWPYVGAGYGMPLGVHLTYADLYYVSFMVVVASILIVFATVRSKIGLRLRAIADDDQAAESYGVDVFRTKLYCWLLASFMTGLAGSLYLIYSGFVTPPLAFNFYWTSAALTSAVIGGRGTIIGPILGAFIVVCLRQYFLVMFPGISMLIYGILIVVVLLRFPHGIIGYIYKRLKQEV